MEHEETGMIKGDLQHFRIQDLVFLRLNSQSCLSKIPDDVFDRFTCQLQFNVSTGRLARADYSEVSRILPEDELAELFSYLGVDRSTFDRSKDLGSVHGTCVAAEGRYCDPAESS